MIPSSSKLITVVGNIATGKSSITPLICEALDAKFLNADTLFQTVCPFRDDYLNNTPRWALANELWLTTHRAELLREAVSNLRPDDKLVIDSGLLMSWVYSYSHFVEGNFTKDEWELYKDLYRLFEQEFLLSMSVVMLDYPTKTLMKRIKKRNRDYELAFYTEKYLKQINKGIKELEKLLGTRGVSVLKISEKEVPDFVEDKDGAVLVRKLVKDFFI